MWDNKWLRVLLALIVANIAYYLYLNWGLVTVKVTDAPLGKVINSIEWQTWGGPKIYTNLPLDTKVTMYVDHVPLAEALETLAVNVDVPPPADGDDNGRPRRDRPPGADGPPGGPPGNAPVALGGAVGQPPAGAPPGGGPRGPGGRGGFARGAQWNLAFFVGPTDAQVNQEIREFQADDPNTDTKIYSYGAQLELISTDSTTTAPDPRLQSWPGMKPPPDPATAPAAADSASTNAAPSQPGGNSPAAASDGPPTVHTYLQALAEAANIWIMAPDSWAPAASAPSPSASIISAIKNLVSSSHGVVKEAFVIRVGRGGQRGGPPNDDAWADRMQNAINGLPPDERPDALAQLNKEVQFRKEVQALPPEQRRQKMFQHFAERMIYGERLARLSPEKRALVYQRMIAMRTAAKAQQ